MLKKLMAVALAGLLTLGSMAMMTTAETEPVTSLLYDFENQEMAGETGAPTGWWTYFDAEGIVKLNEEQTAGQPEVYGLGNKCLEIDCTGKEYDEAAYFSVTLKPNTTYVLSAWVKGVDGEGNPATVYCRVPLLAPGGTNYSADYLTRAWSSGDAAGTKNWHQSVSTPYTTGDEEIATTVWLRGLAGHKVFYDNIALYEVADNYSSFENVKVKDSALVPVDWNTDVLSTNTETDSYAVVSNAKAKTGNYSLEVKSTSLNLGYRVWKPLKGLTPGAKYMVTGYVNVTAPVYNLGVVIYDGSTGGGTSWTANLLSMALLNRDTQQTKDVWMPLVTYFDAPQSGEASLALITNIGYGYLGTTYFDDFTVSKVEAGDDAKYNTGFEYIKSTGTAFVPDGWNSPLSTDTESNSYAIASTERVRTGNYSLQIKNNSFNVGQRVWRQITGLTPGKKYMVSGYMNITSPFNLAGMIVFDDNNGGVGWTSGLGISGVMGEAAQMAAGSNKWLPVVTTFIAPADGIVSLAIGTFNSATTNGTAYFDDITITEVPEGVKYDLKVLDADGKAATALNPEQDNNVTIVLDGTNTTAEEKPYTLVYATYSKDGEFAELQTVSIKSNVMTVPNDKQPGFAKEVIGVTVPKGHTLKVFLFEDMSKIKTAASYSVE